MKAIGEVSQELKWVHPDVEKRYYELRAGEEIVATLEWDSPDGSVAIAKTSTGSWSLRRLGFLNPHVVALETGSGSQVFRFDATMSGGGLAQASDGHHYRWYATLWRAEWGWMDTGGSELVKFHRSFDVDEKHEGNLDVLEKGRKVPQLDLLVTVGWYLIIMVADMTVE
ncbi:MAG: hypothetical protein R3338_08115 [Thermoanaerobaculia bacterium]|nr:hypothetical protein [Thermoanaerobaculia bacterium]